MRPAVGPAAAAARTVAGRVFADPIRTGRPRDVGWPPGLRSVVLAALAVFVVGLALTAASGPLRAGLPLASAEFRQLYVLPRPTVWLLLFMIVFTLALAQTAALHASWWIRALVTVTSLSVMGIWGIRKPSLSYPGIVLTIGLLMAVLLILVIIRARFSYVWWEFPAVLVAIGTSAVLSVAEDLRGVANGVDLAPVLLQETMVALGSLAVPVLFAAGLSVAEVTVSGAVWTAHVGRRLVGSSASFAIVGLSASIWTGHAVWQIAHWDLVAAPPASIGLTTLTAAGIAVLARWLYRVGRRRGPQPSLVVAELGEQLGRYGLPIGAGLTASGLVFVVVVGVIAVVLIVNPLSPSTGSAADAISRIAASIPGSLAFALLAVVVLLAARWLAGRSRPSAALLLGCVAMTLLAVAGTSVSRDAFVVTLNLGVLNLLAGLLLLVFGVSLLLRGRLTRQRAITLSVGFILSGLFAGRDFVSDPIQAVLGLSGVGLAMFGLSWDLLTGSQWANRDGRRLRVPSRLMLLLANSTLGVTVLAYLALTRQSGGPGDPESYSNAGNLILGTALVAATFIAILGRLRADDEVL